MGSTTLLILAGCNLKFNTDTTSSADEISEKGPTSIIRLLLPVSKGLTLIVFPKNKSSKFLL